MCQAERKREGNQAEGRQPARRGVQESKANPMCLEPKMERAAGPRRITKGSQDKLRSWNSFQQLEESQGKCPSRARMDQARMEGGQEAERD